MVNNSFPHLMINICTPAQESKETYITQAPWSIQMIMPVWSDICCMFNWIMTATCVCSLMRTVRHLWRSCYKPKRHIQRRRLNLLLFQRVDPLATRSSVLLAQLVNRFSIFVEMCNFITVSTKVRHCLSWTSRNQSTLGNKLYLRIVLIVSSQLCLAFPTNLHP